MPLFWKPYKSDVTSFIESLKAAKPTLEAEQRAGRSLLWDKALDRDAQAEGVLDDHRPHEEGDVVSERPGQLGRERLLGEQRSEVLEPDEHSPGGPLPAEERIAERGAHRIEDEDPEQHQCRGDEEQPATS